MLKIVLICGDSPNVLELQKSYALLLVRKAKGSLSLNNCQVNLIPGRVFLLRENLPVKLNGNVLTGHLIQFQDLMLRIFLHQSVKHRGKGLYDPHVALPYVDINMDALLFLMSLIAQVGGEMNSGASGYMVRHYLFVLLRHVNRDIEQETILAAEQEQRLTTLLALMDCSFMDNRKTTFYAKKMGMKSRQLNAFTQKHFGKRFFQSLMERIIYEADMLLMEHNLPIKVIAYELGFSHQNEFAVYYRRHKGCSPGGFRKKYCK